MNYYGKGGITRVLLGILLKIIVRRVTLNSQHPVYIFYNTRWRIGLPCWEFWLYGRQDLPHMYCKQTEQIGCIEMVMFFLGF